MRYGRVEIGGGPRWVRIDGEALALLDGDPIAGPAAVVGAAPLAGARLLVPCVPTKIVNIAKNYRAHAAELGTAAPEEAPLFFLKAPSALLDPDGAVVLPAGVGRVDYEGELALVIGRRARRLREAEVRAHLFGYTCLNDVTARGLQKQLGHFTQAKGYDTFCPLGPWIETDLDPTDLAVRTRLNGVLVQDGRSSQMVHSVERLVAALSAVLTLEPGDVIATGTPAGVGPLAAGDVVEVDVEGIGTLRNRVVAEAGAR